MSADNWRDCPKCPESESFREDYEIFSEDDIIYIVYSGYCNKCGFKFSYKDQIKMEN